jgi:Na+/proline symporter
MLDILFPVALFYNVCDDALVSMHVLDYAVIAAYLLGITWFGYRFSKTQKTLKDYFLGEGHLPWWAIAFSIVSAETSTLTVIGTPAIAFRGDFTFLQVVFGYLLARLIISSLLLPHYFRGQMFTAYELMERRFGPRIRKLTAGCFLGLRALAASLPSPSSSRSFSAPASSPASPSSSSSLCSIRMKAASPPSSGPT